jgi:hypothetical protein
MGSLAFLGLLPVYYKTFAFTTGEPFVALFAVLTTYQLLILYDEKNTKERYLASAARLGALIGFLMLSRQWGGFIFPPMVLMGIIAYIKKKQEAWRFIKTIALSLLIASIVGGWFYLTLKIRFGSTIAFNKPLHSEFSFSNQPAKFYFGTGLTELFTHPVRPFFKNQLIPVLYSETWGDYHGYFTYTLFPFRSSDYNNPEKETSRQDLIVTAAYLGRMNLVSLVPSAIIIMSCLAGLKFLFRVFRKNSKDPAATCEGFALIFLNIASSLGLYFCFLIIVPNEETGNTIKASFLLHMFPFVAVLSGELLQRIKQKSRIAHIGLSGFLALTFIHNLPMMFTRYVFFNYR